MVHFIRVPIINMLYSLICYADDILLCSTTVTGLQKMINIASDYIHKMGLELPLFLKQCVDAISVSVSATSMELLKACVLRNSVSP